MTQKDKHMWVAFTGLTVCVFAGGALVGMDTGVSVTTWAVAAIGGLFAFLLMVWLDKGAD